MTAVTESMGGSALPPELISCKEGGEVLRRIYWANCKLENVRCLQKSNCSFPNYMFVKGSNLAHFEKKVLLNHYFEN